MFSYLSAKHLYWVPMTHFHEEIRQTFLWVPYKHINHVNIALGMGYYVVVFQLKHYIFLTYVVAAYGKQLAMALLMSSTTYIEK